MRLYSLTILISVIIIFLDQTNKILLIDFLQNHSDSQVIKITSFFNIVLVYNYGISFGLFQSPDYGSYIFGFIAFVIVIFLLFLSRNMPHKYQKVAIGLIIGGAFGNSIDRFRIGAVADFYDLHFAGYHFPAFNIADIAIFFGAAILIFDSLLQSKK